MNTVMVFLDAIRDHLDLHQLPPVFSVSVNDSARPVAVQLGGGHHVHEVASALLTWAQTLDDVTASLWRVPDGGSVHLSITGRMPCGVPVYVYGGVDFSEDLFPDLPAGAKQDMPVFLLRHWTKAGEVAA